jgi:hypothetical protein
MPPSPRRRLQLGAAALLVLAFALIAWFRSVEPLGLDQGLFACFARWVPRGWLPYRDLFDSKPPLFLYAWSLAALVPGDLPLAAWRLEALWLSATLLVAYTLARRIWTAGTALLVATLLLVGLWSPGWGGYWSRAQAEELLVLPLLGAAAFARTALERERHAFHAGLLTGVAGLFKIPSMAAGGAWLLLWWIRLPARAALRRGARLALGASLPWLLAAAWFAAHGALGDFYRAVFVYHRHNAAFIAPPWSSVFAGFLREMLTHAALLLFAAACGLVVLFRRRAPEAWWLAGWIVTTLAAVILQRQLAGYHFLLTIPALAFAAGFGVNALFSALGPSGRPRLLAAALLLVAALLTARTTATWWTAYAPAARHRLGILDRAAYLAQLQPRGFSSATEEAAAAYLRGRTSPTDGIFVWGLSPGIYALADRHPTTRHPFHKILFTEAPLSRMIPGLDERRRQLIERLTTDPPSYILLGRGDRNGFEPEDSVTSMMKFPALREILKTRYQPETEIGRFVLARRRSP